MGNLKEKFVYDWERLSTAKRVTYGVLIAGALIVLVLSTTGTINLFPV